MFVKFTKIDGNAIWLNASFIVTVEPRRGGGSIVVPIGDGLDYDVRENPETVLAALGEAPAAVVVPVPTRDALTVTPADVSPEPVETKPAPAAPAESAKGTKRHARAKKEPATPADAADAEGVDKVPRKARASRKVAKKEAPAAPAADAEEPAAPAFTDDQIERLRKMAPGSVQKLQNTLASQFQVTEAEPVLRLLAARGILALDRDHVIWKN